MEDPLNLILAAAALLSLGFNVFMYWRGHAHLRFRIGLAIEGNPDGIGTFIGANLSISNVGSKPAFFGCLKAVQKGGDFFYPTFSVKSGTKIEPGDSVVGIIPVGHFVGHNIKGLIVYDGVWKPHGIGRRQLKHSLEAVAAERARLERLGLNVHPTSFSSKH